MKIKPIENLSNSKRKLPSQQRDLPSKKNSENTPASVLQIHQIKFHDFHMLKTQSPISLKLFQLTIHENVTFKVYLSDWCIIELKKDILADNVKNGDKFSFSIFPYLVISLTTK